jgi:hypothetical protein
MKKKVHKHDMICHHRERQHLFLRSEKSCVRLHIFDTIFMLECRHMRKVFLTETRSRFVIWFEFKWTLFISFVPMNGKWVKKENFLRTMRARTKTKKSRTMKILLDYKLIDLIATNEIKMRFFMFLQATPLIHLSISHFICVCVRRRRLAVFPFIPLILENFVEIVA